MFSLLTRGWGNHPEKQFPALTGMLRVFLSRHHDDFGVSIDEMIQSYIEHQMPVDEALEEINNLLKTEDDNDLNVFMPKLAAGEFDPEQWGETWRSFLTRAASILCLKE